MKELSLKKLQSLEIVTRDDGFSIWIVENKDGVRVKHWLLDGSCLKKDGCISFGHSDLYKYNAVYDADENCIKILKK